MTEFCRNVGYDSNFHLIAIKVLEYIKLEVSQVMPHMQLHVFEEKLDKPIERIFWPLMVSVFRCEIFFI